MVLATGSTDQSGSYVFAVEPQGLGRSFSKEGHYWKVADGFDTMFTLWNPADWAEDFVVTFFFGDQGAQYKVPVTLGRNASRTIDVSKIIAAQQPDEFGNVIPIGTREGSVAFSSAKGMTEWMTLAISIGILNAQAATCGSQCTNCCGYSGFIVTPSPGYCVEGLTAQCGAEATFCTGVVYSFTTSSSWSSSDTSILTVDGGLVTGVSPGTANVSATFPLVVMFTGNVCDPSSPPPCPTSTPAPSGPVTVQTPTTLVFVNSELTTYTGQTVKKCDGEDAGIGVRWGYVRCVTYTLGDQQSPPFTIRKAGISIHEDVSVRATNIATASFTRDYSTDGNGRIADFLALLGTTSTSIPTNACTYAKQTLSTVVSGSSRTLRINCLHYTATDVSITDITSNPNNCPTTCP